MNVYVDIQLFEDNNYYCETCGYSDDQLHYVHKEDPDGEYDFTYEITISVGCYGGDSRLTNDPVEAVEFLRQAAVDYPYAKQEIEYLIHQEGL